MIFKLFDCTKFKVQICRTAYRRSCIFPFQYIRFLWLFFFHCSFWTSPASWFISTVTVSSACHAPYIKTPGTIVINNALWIIIWKQSSVSKKVCWKPYAETFTNISWKIHIPAHRKRVNGVYLASAMYRGVLSLIRRSTRGAGNMNVGRARREINTLWRALQHLQ